MIGMRPQGDVREFDEVDSTQNVARAALEEGDPAGIFLARHQTRGRGRFERNWHSEPGSSLTMSLLYRELTDHPMPWLLGMAVAVSAAEALDLCVQWPNDIVYEGRKLGGVLVEMVEREGARVPIVGLGLNINQMVWPSEIAERATSLAEILGRESDVRQVAEAVLYRLESRHPPESWAMLEQAWRAIDETAGKRFALNTGETGIAAGLERDGSLRLDVDGQIRKVYAADAIFG